MKKIIALHVVSLALASTMAQSNPPSDMPKLTPEQEYEIFTKDGLPLPGSGVHIIPLAKMQSVNLTQERSRIKSLTGKGYVDEYNSNAVELLTIQEAIKQDLISTGSNINPTNTHIHMKFEDMQIAYDYKAVPSTVAEESLGFAANGAYLNEKGWSGVVQFFKPKGLPSTDVCSYRQSNLQLTGGAANLAKELVTYNVNNKPTIIEAAGNKASGYGYTVEWYDDNFRHVLECADKMYSKPTADAVIELAKQIDSNIS